MKKTEQVPRLKWVHAWTDDEEFHETRIEGLILRVMRSSLGGSPAGVWRLTLSAPVPPVEIRVRRWLRQPHDPVKLPNGRKTKQWIAATRLVTPPPVRILFGDISHIVWNQSKHENQAGPVRRAALGALHAGYSRIQTAVLRAIGEI